MAYFGAIKITDVNGNVVELTDVTETLESINLELKAIHKILEEAADIEITKEDVEDVH